MRKPEPTPFVNHNRTSYPRGPDMKSETKKRLRGMSSIEKEKRLDELNRKLGMTRPNLVAARAGTFEQPIVRHHSVSATITRIRPPPIFLFWSST